MIRYIEPGQTVVDGDGQIDGLIRMRVVDCIFQQVYNDLFDQGGIHGHHDKFIRYRNVNNGIGKPLVEALYRLRGHFFQGL